MRTENQLRRRETTPRVTAWDSLTTRRPPCRSRSGGIIIHGIPPEAEFPGIVPIDTTLLGRSDQTAVAITGLAAFSNGFEIQLTARSRPDDDDVPGPGPGLGRARHSFRFGLQLPDGRKVFGRHGPGRPGGPDKEPEGPLLQAFAGGGTPLSFLSRWWAWPLPPKGALEFVAEWPDLGLPESRVSLDAGMILDAADRAIRLWPEPGAA